MDPCRFTCQNLNSSRPAVTSSGMPTDIEHGRMGGLDGWKDARGSPQPPSPLERGAVALTALTKWPMWSHYGRRKARRARAWQHNTTPSGQTAAAAGRAKEAPRSSFLHSERATNRRARPIRLTIPPFYCVACQLSVRRVRGPSPRCPFPHPTGGVPRRGSSCRKWNSLARALFWHGKINSIQRLPADLHSD